MKGHVIVERDSKAGWVFVPDDHIRFQILVLEEEGCLSASETHPEASPGLVWSAHREETVKKECDFVSEVDIPAEMMCLAWYGIMRNDIFNKKDAKVAYEKMLSYAKGKDDWPDLETLGKDRFGDRTYPRAMGLNKDGRFALYRQVQGWILEAGGLVF